MKFELGTLTVRKRNRLPHWDAECAVYFITFNLYDAIPDVARLRIREEAEAQASMIRSARGELTPAEDAGIQQWVTSKMNGVLDDSRGSCFMRDHRIASIVANAITYFDGDRYRLLCWCVMPNHVHVVCTLHDRLERVLHSWKSFSAKRANQVLRRQGKFWQESEYDRCIRDSEELARTVDYVLTNPAKAGLHDWPFVAVYPERIASLVSPGETPGDVRAGRPPR